MAPVAQRCARAVIEYDGTAFAGSQRQPQRRTVQSELEDALNRLTGERITVRFAGRTDAGVHATGQVIAFCLPVAVRRERIGLAELRRRLNAVLPPDVVVRSLRAAPPGFDPRRAATARTYRYRIRQACELLRSSDQPITQIALAVGFSDSAHFTRTFQREMNVTPRAFRHNKTG